MSTDPSDRSPRSRSANRQRPSSRDHIGERLRSDASAPSRDRSKQKLESAAAAATERKLVCRTVQVVAIAGFVRPAPVVCEVGCLSGATDSGQRGRYGSA